MYNEQTHPDTRQKRSNAYRKLVLWLTFAPVTIVIAIGTVLAAIKPDFMGF